MIAAVFALAALPFSALVVDGSGEPLEDVWVAPVEGRLATGASGRVTGRTTAALLAFRKREYRTVVVAPGEGLTVVMERTGTELPLPRCGKPADGWTFQVRGAGAGREFHDIDYWGRSYRVKTRSGRHDLRHGRGPHWSYGVPPARYLEQAAEYEERTYGDITAARGVLRDGTRWRYLGVFGESVSYETADAEAARKLDVWMDRACVAR